MKNESRTKNVVKLDIDQSKGHILQICSSDAEVKIDNIIVGDSGLKAVGKSKYVSYIFPRMTQNRCVVSVKKQILSIGLTQTASCRKINTI